MLKLFLLGTVLWAGTDFRDHTELTVLVFGDAGTGESGQFRVGEAMFTICQERSCDFALMLGDNIYENGIEVRARTSASQSYSEILRQFETKFELPYQPFLSFEGFRFWAILGNHDYRRNAVGAMITYSEFSELWRMPAFHYDIPGLPDWLQIYGVMTDTDVGRNLNGLQVESAKRALCGEPSRERWKLLFGHQPVYNSGHHRNDANERRTRALLEGPLIQACGVHLYLAGHAHHQEHLTAPGFEQIVQGAAARSKGRNRPTRAGPVRQNHFSREFGFGIIEIDRNRLRIDYYDVLGTKEKGAQNPVPRRDQIVRSHSWCGTRADVGKPTVSPAVCVP